MLSGEYLVLKGAKALALPAKFGQDLWVDEIEGETIFWKTLLKNRPWFSAEIDKDSLDIKSTNRSDVALRLQHTLREARLLNPGFLTAPNACSVTASIDFDLEWGLGSSSSFISNIAWWAECDPYVLNKRIFKGSGYDIACARSLKPVVYQLKEGEQLVTEVEFNPAFTNQLYFVWLNQKQDTRQEIGRFDQSKNYDNEIIQVNSLTEKLFKVTSLCDFQELMKIHENVISKIIGSQRIQDRLFPDFKGTIKSLGAWGGDFILAASEQSFEQIKKYFNQKDYRIVLRYNDLF